MLLILVVLGSNIGCDQVSKNIVRRHIDFYEQISVVSTYVTLTKTENSGAFLSLGHDLPQPFKGLLLTFLPLGLLGLALIYLFSQQKLSLLNRLGFSFILGGGIGNVYDRILYGSVTDFLHIDFVLFQTGIFNMADVSIMIGGFTVLYEAYFKQGKLSSSSLEK